MDNDNKDGSCSRRDFINTLGAGFTTLALTGMLSADGYFPRNSASNDPLAPKKPHFPAKAKSCIFLFMYGGPSQMETFDYKPKLDPLDGQTVRGYKTHGRGGHRDGAKPRP